MEEKLLFELSGDRFFGTCNDLFVYEDRLVLRTKFRPGCFLTLITLGILNFVAKFLNGEKIIYLADINSIFISKVGKSRGVLSFTIPVLGNNGTGVGASVFFRKEKRDKAVEIVDFVNDSILKIKPINADFISVADEIRKYKELLDEGIISSEDFEKKKNELLS